MPESDLPAFDLSGELSLEPLLRKFARRRARMEPLYAEMLEAAKGLVRPVVLKRAFPSAEVPDFADPLRMPEQVVLGLCSLGEALESHVAEIFADEPAKAVVLDEIGNAWVAGLARQLHREIRAAAAAEGLRAGPGFRPGIGHWPVELQPRIFLLLQAEQHGVRLTGGLMMEPRKSVSMIVAVGRRLARTAHAPTPDDG